MDRKMGSRSVTKVYRSSPSIWWAPVAIFKYFFSCSRWCIFLPLALPARVSVSSLLMMVLPARVSVFCLSWCRSLALFQLGHLSEAFLYCYRSLSFSCVTFWSYFTWLDISRLSVFAHLSLLDSSCPRIRRSFLWFSARSSWFWLFLVIYFPVYILTGVSRNSNEYPWRNNGNRHWSQYYVKWNQLRFVAICSITVGEVGGETVFPTRIWK